MEYLVGAIGIIAFLLLAGWMYESLSKVRDRKRHPPAGNLYPVNAHRLHLYCTGERRPQQPTVVLEAGMGNCSFDWRLIQPAVAQWGRVCAYDRAGYGWSDASRAVGSLQQRAADLHTLLTKAGESGPYVLVGHSFGGILVREFARQHPQEVVGMVLVDSAHEGQIGRLSADEFKQLKVSLRLYRALSFLDRVGLVRLLARPLLLSRFPSVRSPEDQSILLTLISRPEYMNTLCAESQALMQSSITVPPALGQMPLVVIQAAGRPPALPRNYSEERWQQTRKMFDDIQHELAGLSSNSQLVRAEKSVHAVQVEQPEIVIAAIRQMLEAGSQVKG